MTDSGATDRVWRQLPPEARDALEAGLSPTDLQTLLLSVAKTRATQVKTATLLQRW